jgi:hypothetical protein
MAMHGRRRTNRFFICFSVDPNLLLFRGRRKQQLHSAHDSHPYSPSSVLRFSLFLFLFYFYLFLPLPLPLILLPLSIFLPFCFIFSLFIFSHFLLFFFLIFSFSQWFGPSFGHNRLVWYFLLWIVALISVTRVQLKIYKTTLVKLTYDMLAVDPP